jgi:AbrB family looped-hinge helix DNA binding protein
VTASSRQTGQALRVGQHGRIVLPIEFRRELGIAPGDALVVWLEDGRMVIQSRAAVQHELWDMFKGVDKSLADELLTERRAEATRED